MLAGKAIRMAMSYVMHSFRPRLSLAAGREIMHFSKWILVTGLVTLVNRRGGTLLIAKFLDARSEEHTSELQSLMRISYAVFCLKKKKIPMHHMCRHERLKPA